MNHIGVGLGSLSKLVQQWLVAFHQKGRLKPIQSTLVSDSGHTNENKYRPL